MSEKVVDIHLVVGSTGEYENYHEWVVKAYRDRDKAVAHANLAEQEAERIFKKNGSRGYYGSDSPNPYDPNMDMDYTGTFYEIQTIDLEED